MSFSCGYALLISVGSHVHMPWANIPISAGAVAAGQGDVAIGSSVQGGIVVTGNQNVVGTLSGAPTAGKVGLEVIKLAQTAAALYQMAKAIPG